MVKKLLKTLLITGILVFLSGCRSNDAETAGNTAGNNIDSAASSGNAAGENADNDINLNEDNSVGDGTAEASAAEDNIKGSNTEENNSKGDNMEGGLTVKSIYRLDGPVFIEVSDDKLCRIARDYIDLSDSEFDEKYSEEKLWENGAFDRLLFTKNAKGKIIDTIGIGSPLKKVLTTFGEPQFGTSAGNENKTVYHLPLLYGYKTGEFYFVFEIDPKTDEVLSICFRKRYPMPQKLKDMLPVMAKYGDWYNNPDFYESPEMAQYLKNDKVTLTQWGRGTMTMICNYGFTSTSGMGISYGIYADYEGDIPVLPESTDEYTGEAYDPVNIFDTDYPEELIYRIYGYLEEQNTAIENGNGKVSPDKKIFAYAVDSDLLDLNRASGLYETAHVIIHWLDGGHPDRQIYLGHYSTVIGYIGNRYLVESNMIGLHVYDLDKSELVFQEDTVEGRNDLTIDEEQKKILDSEGKVQYTYELDSSGEIKVRKVN